MSRAEVENVEALASVREDAKGLVWKIILLEGKLLQSVRTGRCLRGSTEKNSRSSPFYRSGALS
jgi:hypothetical protein